MLKTRVIPTLLWKNVGLVKGLGFDSWRRVGSVLPSVKVYNLRDVDELILLDIAATPEKRQPRFDELTDIARECFFPLTFGGGLSTLEDITQALRAGADKVALNTLCFENLPIVAEAAKKFGSQCIVASMDVRKKSGSQSSTYECFSHCGSRATGQEAVAWAKKLAEHGVGEILVTDIDRDGTMQGFDLPLIRSITDAVSIPVIAAGGAGLAQHFVDAIVKGGATAVAAAAVFHFTELTPRDAKQALAAAGVPVRR